MRRCFCLATLFFGLSLGLAHAGSVISLTERPVVNGKLTLGQTTLHVEGVSPVDIDLSDILEADFSNAPFHLDYFSSRTTRDHLPPEWQSQDTGKHNDSLGSYSYANGIFTLTSNCHVISDWSDPAHVFLIGRPWTGNGQWTLRLKSYDPQNGNAEAGPILWESAGSTGKLGNGVFQVGTNGNSQGHIFMRNSNGGYYGHSPEIDLPTWLRLVRNGSNLAALVSKDGKSWDILNQTISWFSGDTWAGLYIANGDKPAGRHAIDQVTFTPGPALSDVLPTGLLLRSGTFLVGYFGQFAVSGPDSKGEFLRHNQTIPIAAGQIAVVLFEPTTWSQIDENGSQSGLLLKNGDFNAGDIQLISAGDPDVVRVNSLTLGISDFGDRFGDTAVQAAFFNPLNPQPANYEIRLNDGSIIRANGINWNKRQAVITDASGVNISVDPSDIAQFRAGPARVQNLLSVPWKTTLSAATPEKAAVAAPESSGIEPECWEGNEQEQIMVAPPQMAINFPLKGKFRALAMKMAIAPGSPADAGLTVRVLADGKEIDRTVLSSTGAVQFSEVPLRDPKTITVIADSSAIGARVLLIDPVVLLDNQK